MANVGSTGGPSPLNWKQVPTDTGTLAPPTKAPLPTGGGPLVFKDGFETNKAPTGASVALTGRTPPPPAPTPVGTTGTPVSTTGTRATYTLGPPTRPNITHDNGFRQNPANPNDPNPIPTVSPTLSDYGNLAIWEGKLAGARALQGVPGVPHNNIGDGLDAYDHFLHGGGRDSTFSYERFVSQDPSGRAVLQNATRDTQLAAQQAYRDMVAKDPSLANRPITFQITGSAISVGRGSSFPYPATENWQKAIGGHQIWNSATVTVNPPATPGGEPQFSMRMTLHGEDRYNFNPGAQDIATGTPDADNGRFELTGLGNQFMNYGELQRNVTWSSGHPENAVSTPVNGR